MTTLKRTIFFIAAFFFFNSNLQAVSVSKLIKRIQKNVDKISAKKIKMNVDSMFYSGEEFKAELTLLIKSPDKIKITGFPTMPGVFINGNKMTVHFMGGTVSKKEITNNDMQNIARPELGYNWKNFIASYKASLNKKEYDKKQKIYVLELLPKTTETMPLHKIKWFVDYKKEFICKVEMYDSSGKLNMVINYPEIKQIQGLWLPVKSELILYKQEGEITTSATLEYFEINKDIPAQEFEP